MPQALSDAWPSCSGPNDISRWPEYSFFDDSFLGIYYDRSGNWIHVRKSDKVGMVRARFTAGGCDLTPAEYAKRGVDSIHPKDRNPFK